MAKCQDLVGQRPKRPFDTGARQIRVVLRRTPSYRTDVAEDLKTQAGDQPLRLEQPAMSANEWVQIDLDEASEDLDHLITPEERFRISMARQ
jgi:hypothetical protein